MNTSDLVMASFLCRQQLRHLASLEDGRRIQHCRGAVLFVDVVGFTAVTESFAEQGRLGPERLSGLVRRSFGLIVDRVVSFGGDVVAFAGDAVWALWPTPDPDARGCDKQLGSSVCLAARCAVGIQRDLEAAGSSAETQLRIRAAIGAGEVELLTFTTAVDRCEFVVVGRAIQDAGRVGGIAQAGDTLLSATAVEVAGASVHGVRLAGGELRVKSVAHAGIAGPCGTVSDPEPARPSSVRHCLPAFIVQRVDAGLVDWLAEFRTVSMAFVGLHGIDFPGAGPERRLGHVLERIQAVVRRYDGEVYQVLMDEKGLGVVLAFGLPLQSHEEDPERAVRASLEIQRVLADTGVRASIGVTTGTVFCSVCGSDQRRAYMMTGTALNVAARLMQAAAGFVLCDARTIDHVTPRSGLSFEPARSLTLGGRRDTLTAHRAVSCHGPGRAETRWTEQQLLGRRSEIAALARAVDDLCTRGECRVVLIEGAAGIGKSHLVRHWLRTLNQERVRILVGHADSVDRSTNYHALRSVFVRLFGIDVLQSEDSRRAQCTARLGSHERVVLAPLLNAVLPLDLPENETTAALTDEGRAQRTRELLISCLQEPDHCVPTVLVLEDVQWLDSASWSLFVQAVRSVPQLLGVATSRPVESDLDPFCQHLVETPGCQRVALGPLSSGEIGALVRAGLGVDRVPPAVFDLVVSRSKGNPFFSLELAHALRDYDVVTVDRNQCIVIDGDPARAFDDALIRRGLPSTLQGIVASRIDRLSPEDQLVLKVASVIGKTFSLPVLSATVPLANTPGTLVDRVDRLVQVGMLRIHTNDPEPEYEIGHALLQEAVYDCISFSQRRELHLAVARWYEARGVTRRLHPILAHHFSRAGISGQALLHLEAAGAEALRLYANAEAVRFFAEALKLGDTLVLEQGPSVGARRRQARNELCLGRAYVCWSDYAASREHLERGLQSLGRWVPRWTIWVALLLVIEVIRQLLYRSMRSRSAHAQGRGVRDDLLLEARAYEGLAESYFNTGQNLLCLYGALRSLNVAERAGPSAELARGYSSLGAILGFVPVDRAARYYCRRAMEVARAVNDRPAQAWVAIATGVYEAGQGRWSEAARLFEQTATLGQAVGDARRCDDSAENQAAMAFFVGNCSRSLRLACELEASAVRRHDGGMQCSALRQRAYCMLRSGNPSDAAALLAELERLRREQRGISAQQHVDVLPLEALLRWRRGELELARAAADEGLRQITRFSPMFYATLLEYDALAEVHLGLRDAGRVDDPKTSRAACRQLRRFARIFLIARPAAALWTGVEHWLSGRSEAARAAWTQALRLAQEAETPHWEAQAHYQLGVHLDPQDPARAVHLARTVELLGNGGDPYYVALAQSALCSR
ncbi:MAG: AAA family ATPase [Polyangiaceae bacterium]|nr:AAA family ATPase [Polyangiaceae bacterium]